MPLTSASHRLLTHHHLLIRSHVSLSPSRLLLSSSVLPLLPCCLHQLTHLRQCHSSLNRPLKVAVIGSGPAGFYLTQQLLKGSPHVTVDIFEKFPAPFGLVRYGVAPDHPEVKNVEHSFTKTAENPRVSFIGNVNIGSRSGNPSSADLSLPEIRDAYNVVALCYGSAKDRQLNIPGENLTNALSARRFVGWYNGVPYDQDLAVNLNSSSCVIIGHGNVALDCARILLTPVDNGLTKTDITNKAIESLKRSRIRTVHIVGRRGPLQVQFTIKELRELTKIPSCQAVVFEEDVSFLTKDKIDSLPRARRRLTELIYSLPRIPRTLPLPSDDKLSVISFLRSPLSIDEEGDNSYRITFGVNRLLDDPFNEKTGVEATNEREHLSSGLIIKSLGYTTISLDPTLPMDEKRGRIKNEGGKIFDNLYCSGWAATGPSGVLVGTMNVSFEVGRRILRDAESGLVDLSLKEGGDKIRRLLTERGVKYVTFNDWKRIDSQEILLGQAVGKPREKLISIDDLLKAAGK